MSNVKEAQNRQLRSAKEQAGLRVRLLGPMSISIDGERVNISSKRARALLGYLALREGAEIPRGTLTGLLWGERAEKQARASLRQTLTELRAALSPSNAQPIMASKEAVAWRKGSAWVDANALSAVSDSTDDDALRNAADMIGGELMEGLSFEEPGFEEWLRTERENFRLLACQIYKRMMERAEQSGRLEEALTSGLKLLSLDSLQEHVHRALMRIYSAQGRHDAALAQYERCKGELSSGLRVVPETETETLVQSIRKNRREGSNKSTILQAHEPAQEDEKQSTLTDRASIAVLPFTNMSNDADGDFFVDGLTEDIITALSRVSGFLVIAHTSTLTYKGMRTDPRLVARELGVRYLMEGSVRRSGDRLRVTAQLIDAVTSRQIWREQYDRSLADVFDIQDDITRSVAASTQTQVELAERYVAETRSSVNFKARDLIARASGRIYDQTPESAVDASDLVEEAIRIDPTNPKAHRMRAAVLLNRIWILHDTADTARAFELAKYALYLAPHDEYAHLTMAWAWAYAAGRFEEAIAECELGLEINPNCSLILGNLGYYLAALGRSQEAIKACQLALRLNPRDPSNFWRHHAMAMAHFVAANYAACLQESKRIARSRSHLPSSIIWAASAAGLEMQEEARSAVENCLVQRPDLRVGNVAPKFMLRFARDEDHERLTTLLQKAGIPA